MAMETPAAQLRVLLLPRPCLARHLRAWRASHGAGDLDVLPGLGLAMDRGLKGSKDQKKVDTGLLHPKSKDP